MSADGVRNQLGRPQLSLFEVLAREAIQNSWDARTGSSSVRFRMDARACTAVEQRGISQLLGKVPESLPLKESLSRRPLHLLVISDQGTSGLGGPTRADIELPGGREHDFVAFVRNVGEPRDKELGAGTFGFGKTVFYLVSRARTAIVYTRCRIGRNYESRLIGCAIGASFRIVQGSSLRPYTGRHWWGMPKNGVQEPLTDKDADKAAAVFGLTPFGKHTTGTSIAILDPAFNDPVDDMRALSWSIIWHAWPKAISGQMTFSLSWNGNKVQLPDAEVTPPLDAFVKAYRQLNAGEAVECYKPQKRLGRLVLHRQVVRDREPDYPASFEAPISSPVHHVALLRAPHLVVRYFPGDSLPGEYAEYAGVFEANPEIDDVFAAAEPPTHDDWIAKQLEGESRTFVNTTFSRISERLRGYARPITGETLGTGGVPLGSASNQFADLVATSGATGGTSSLVPPGAGSKRDHRPDGDGGGDPGKTIRTPGGTIEEVGLPRYDKFARTPALFFGFRVRSAPAGSQVRAMASVGTDDNNEAELASPAGCSQPRVLGWLGPQGEVVNTDALSIDGRVGQLWNVAIAPEPNTVTTVSLKLEAATS